ncbi:MAG: glycosyltransferase family 2 protein, partial [Nanoarchaeota archaeon]|nr:glycosyltransferase family 2 protein [Nanoarchaeota archaeon]
MKKQSGKDKEIEVSFIIVNYNGGETLERAIRSIKEQNFSEDKREIILVDNNSGDGSADEFADDKSITLIRSDENLGFAGGNNLGIDKSSGKYLALINNDVLLDRDWTRKIVSKMNSDYKIGIIGNEIFLRDTGIVWHGGAKIFFPGFVKHLNIKKESEMNFVNFASVMIRRDANVRFDENFFMYYEDVDYCRQIMKKGLKIVYMPEAKSYHFIKPRRASAAEEYYINRN